MTAPSVLLVAGGDEFRRSRLIRTIATTRSKKGWKIESISGKDPALEETLASYGSFLAESCVVLLSDPEKADLSVLLSQIQHPNESVLLVMDHDGEVSASSVFHKKIVTNLPKECIRVFPAVPFYKAAENAASLVQEEAKVRGVRIDANLAEALVTKTGTDLGFLTFEVLKAAMITPRGEPITATTLKSTMAPILDLGHDSLVEAIGSHNLPWAVREMARYRAGESSDPTIKFCGQALSPTVIRWLQASVLHDSKIDPKSAAARVNANPWYWEHKVLPPAVRWGTHGCVRLLNSISEAQQAVFQGASSPWNLLEIGIIRAFKRP